MDTLERIEVLKDERITPNTIEEMLLDGRLGNVNRISSGRCTIGSFQRSRLVVEAYNPGFIQQIGRVRIVHHKDGDPSNDKYVNLQVMERGDHTSLYWEDGDNKEAARKKISKSVRKFFNDPKSKKIIEVRNQNISNYYDIPGNREVLGNKISKGRRESWIKPEDNPEFFNKWFTIEQYAKLCNIRLDRADWRLRKMYLERKLTRKYRYSKNTRLRIFKSYM